MRTKPAELDRRLGQTEHIYWLLDQLYCLNFVAVAELEGTLNADDLQTALDIVQQENPALRTQITTTKLGRPCFEPVSADRRRLTVEVHELRNWRRTIEAQIVTPFKRGEAPLARFLWFRGKGKKSVVAMVFHHSIGDGKSGVCALFDVLRRAVGQDLRPQFKEAQPSSQQLDLIQDKGLVGGKLRELKFWLGFGMDALKFPVQLPDFDTTVRDTRKIKTIPFTISRKTSKALLAVCRDNDTTIHGALGAAMLFAVSDEFDEIKPRYLGLNSLVDLRGGMKGGLTEQDLGLYISTVTTVHLLKKQPDFWSLAAEIPSHLKEIINSGDANLVHGIYPELPLFTPDKRGAKRLQKVVATSPPSPLLTNIGRVAGLPLGKELRIGTVSFAVAPPPRNFFSITVASYDGQMHSNLMYDQCQLKDKQAERLAENVLARLEQEVG